MKCEGGCGQPPMRGGVTCGRPRCQVTAFRAAQAVLLRPLRPKSPRDGRCKRDPAYHERIRSDHALFDAEAIKLGPQEGPGIKLELGLCPGCGTCVSKLIEDTEPEKRKETLP